MLADMESETETWSAQSGQGSGSETGYAYFKVQHHQSGKDKQGQVRKRLERGQEERSPLVDLHPCVLVTLL